MTEEKRDCTNCGNGIICACTAFNQWQPIAQEKKTMENKVIFESEEECIKFLQTCYPLDIIEFEFYDKYIEKAQLHGYIRKSKIEEAEEIIEKIKNFWEKHDQPYELVLKELTSFEIAINQLKSEIARLKK